MFPWLMVGPNGLFCVNKIVNGFRSNNVIKIIMNTLLKGGGLNKEDLSKTIYVFEKME
jgi:uncharacterized sodium:solute symporter family permease YidK